MLCNPPLQVLAARNDSSSRSSQSQGWIHPCPLCVRNQYKDRLRGYCSTAVAKRGCAASDRFRLETSFTHTCTPGSPFTFTALALTSPSNVEPSLRCNLTPYRVRCLHLSFGPQPSRELISCIPDDKLASGPDLPILPGNNPACRKDANSRKSSLGPLWMNIPSKLFSTRAGTHSSLRLKASSARSRSVISHHDPDQAG